MAVENEYGTILLDGNWYVTRGNRVVAGPFPSPTAHYYASLWHAKNKQSCH